LIWFGALTWWLNMSTEFTSGQHAPATAGNRPQSIDRRRNDHPVEVKVFGGTRDSERRIGVGAGVIWFATVVLTLLAVWVYFKASQNQLDYQPGVGFGYYLGLVGGVMMLLMLLYPVRKHMQFTRSWGPLRYWFMLHMIFGIGGPVLILFHTTFHVRSLNAGVALYSMLLVAASGIIGRFIYIRIHQGLYGRKLSLDELQNSVDLNQKSSDRLIALVISATAVDVKLQQFRDLAFETHIGIATRIWRFMTFDWRRYRLTRKCRNELKRAIVHLAKAQGWEKREQHQHVQDAMMYVKRYLASVQRAAQFSAFERLFRLWHVLHSPFVWLLGVSGIVHVIATNFMY
jgi:hypothetical protein